MKSIYNSIANNKRHALSLLKAMLVCCLFAFTSAATYAQSVSVSGVVSSNSGDALMGATVVIPGTSKYALTALDGSYSIEAENGDELLFQFVGYESQSIVVDKAVINVALTEIVNELDELVVVAYGTQKKRDVIGSVSTVKSDDLIGGSSGDFTQALQGAAAGLQVVSAGTNFSGGAPEIKIRGVSSISSDVDPLWVIDGMIGGESDVNMNDIESIEVLKDASATAIYGSRGSNGVIIVTTKRGKKGAPQVNVSYKYGVTPIINGDIGVANTEEAFNVYNISYANTYSSGSFTESFNNYVSSSTGATTQITSAIAQATDVNYFDLLSETGSFHDANVSITHGGEYTTNYASINYRSDDYSLSGKERQALKVRLNSTYQKGNLTVGFQLSGLYSKTDDLSQWSSVGTQPFIPVYDESDESGLWNPYEANASLTANVNPLVNMDPELNQDETLELSIRANMYLDYKFEKVEGLSFRVDGGFTTEFTQNNIWRSLVYSYNPDEGITGTRNKTNEFGQQYHAFFTYNKVVGEHSFGAVAGTEIVKSYSDYLNLTGTNIVGYYPEMALVGEYESSSMGYIASEERTLSMFARLDYKFMDRYLVSGSFSREGTAKFAANNRWGNFFSASAGWILSEENFLNSVEWLSLLKLRGSFGETGNQNIPTAATQTVITTKSTMGYDGATTVYYESIGNADAMWEKTQNIDLGVDFALFNNRLSGSVAYYRQNVKDMLLEVSLPASAGNTSQSMWYNTGDMRNQGLEFAVQYNVFNKKDFKWTTNFNITTNKNEVTALSSLLDSTGTGIISGRCIIKTGSALTTYYLPVYAGVDSETGVGYLYQVETDPVTGAQTLSGDTVEFISANQYTNQYAMDGYQALPTYYGAWNNNFQYKNFDLGISLYFSGGNYIYNEELFGDTGGRGGANIMDYWLENSWQEVGDDALFPQLTFTDDKHAATGVSANLEKGDYLRLRDLTFGYTLPNRIAQKLNLSKFRVYISMSNIATWTQFSGYDPEMAINQTSGSTFSLTSTPNTASYIFGVDLSF